MTNLRDLLRPIFNDKNVGKNLGTIIQTIYYHILWTFKTNYWQLVEQNFFPLNEKFPPKMDNPLQ
jgi:hypothetical protein